MILNPNPRVDFYGFNMMFFPLRLTLSCGRWLVDYNLLCLINFFSYNQYSFFKLFVREFIPKSFHRILPCGSRLALSTWINWEETKNFLTSTFSLFQFNFSFSIKFWHRCRGGNDMIFYITNFLFFLFLFVGSDNKKNSLHIMTYCYSVPLP